MVKKQKAKQLKGLMSPVVINNDKIKPIYSEQGNIRGDMSGMKTLETEEKELEFLEGFMVMIAITVFITGMTLCAILVHSWL